MKTLGKLLYLVLGFFIFAGITASINADTQHLTPGTLLSVAVVGGYLNPDVQMFRVNLGKKVAYEVWWRSKLSKFISMINHVKYKETGEYSSMKGSLPPSAGIVHAIQDFEAAGGVDYEMPILRPLTGQGVIGTHPLTNQGEKRMWFTQKLKINMRRHALEVRDNEMTEQMLDPKISAKLLERGSGDLQDWFSRLLPFEMWFSLFRGYAENITDSSFGRSVTAKSHPNSYVQGNGRINFTTPYTFNAAFETAYAAALATLSDTSSKHFNAQSIKNMVFLARKHRIQPIVVKGYEVFLIFVTSAHMRQLRNDPEWYQAQKDAAPRSTENQIFTGVSEGHLFEGAYICVDDTMPAARVTGDTDTAVFGTAYAAALGTVNYGVTNYMANPRDVSPRKAAVLLGAGAVLAANVKGFKLTTEITDHGQKIEDGGRMIYGFQRTDLIDDDNVLGNGANLFYDNTSSLVYWTWTPDIITV
jgi:hypothetical protein